MTTSGSYDYSATASDVITEALEILSVLPAGGTVTTDDETSMLRTLNFMVKQWSGNFDFAPGLKAFSRKRGYLFLQDGQSSYSLGPTGDNTSLSYVTTTLTASKVATDTSLTVSSNSGVTTADKIGILLDSGAIQWTTVSSTSSTDTIVIPAPGLTGSAASGNRVFIYTTKLMRPLYIEHADLLDTSGVESQILPISLDSYESLPTPISESDPAYHLYENTIGNGTIRFDAKPSDVTKVVKLTFLAPAEDLDAVANDISYPQEWFAALANGLAKRAAPKYTVKWTAEMESNYGESLSIARSSYAETVQDYFQPGLE